MMDHLTALRIFVRVVERGNFTSVGREFGVSQPTISKVIAALEADFSARLLNRTSRSLQSTSAGQDLYDAAKALLRDFDEAQARIRRGSASVSGKVSIATFPAFARMYVIPRLPTFLQRYPELSIDIKVSERRIDLIQEAADVAVRVGSLSDSALIASKIGSLSMITVAAPSYLARRGKPEALEELAHHDLIAAQTNDATQPWRFKGEDGDVDYIPSAKFRSNDAEDLKGAVLAGIGIGYAASALFAPELEDGSLAQVLETLVPQPLPVYAIHVGSRSVPERVRVVLDFLQDVCASEEHLRIRQ